MIQAVQLTDGGYKVTLDDGNILSVPDDGGNRHYQAVQDWIAEGNTPDAADPKPSAPTTDEIYDQTIAGQQVLNALISAINDGSIVPGASATNAALKTAITAKM